MLPNNNKLSLIPLAAALMLAGPVTALPTPTQAQQAGPLEVRMLDQGTDGEKKVFEPALLQIQPGDTVEFIAWDFGHDLVSVDGLQPEGTPAFTGYKNADTAVTFERQGVYIYQCAAHQAVGMVGVIVAGDAAVNLDQVLAAYKGNKALSEPARERLAAILAQIPNQ